MFKYCLLDIHVYVCRCDWYKYYVNVRVFLFKYIYVYVCWKTKRYIAVFICLLTKSVYLYVWGDFDIHAKSKTLEGGKYTDFIMVMNIFLLAPCCPTLAIVSICMLWNVWAEAVWAHESESCPAGSQNIRERKLSELLTI